MGMINGVVEHLKFLANGCDEFPKLKVHPMVASLLAQPVDL